MPEMSQHLVLSDSLQALALGVGRYPVYHPLTLREHLEKPVQGCRATIFRSAGA